MRHFNCEKVTRFNLKIGITNIFSRGDIELERLDFVGRLELESNSRVIPRPTSTEELFPGCLASIGKSPKLCTLLGRAAADFLLLQKTLEIF